MARKKEEIIEDLVFEEPQSVSRKNSDLQEIDNSLGR